MLDATAWTASQWLALDPGSAAALFAGDKAQAQALYRRLARRWHPDRNPDPLATRVFATVHSLYAGRRGRSVAAVAEVADAQGRRFRFQGTAQEPFELGMFLRGRTRIAWRVEAAHVALAQSFAKTSRCFVFATPALRAQMTPLLPQLEAEPMGPDGALLVVRRQPSWIRLRDALTFYAARHEPFPARHAAWVVSGLMNLGCFLQVSRLAHQAILAESIWIDPGQHSVHLLGGWFYAQPFGRPVEWLPAASVLTASRAYRDAKKADASLDRELIRALGREILGDRHGLRLHKTTPKPIRDALCFPSAGDAVTDYRDWRKALQASFGPPTFVPMDLTAEAVYQENDHG